MFRLICLLLLAGAVQARPDIFANREWEPNFRVLRSTFLEQVDGAAGPAERQVFTCLLELKDLQLRRCDTPGALPAAPDDTLRSQAGGCYRAEYEISLEVFSGKGRRRVSRASRYHHEEFTLESSRLEGVEPRRWRHFQLDLPPGRYTWWVEFQDLNSRRHLRREGEFQVRDLSGETAAISGLWLLAEADSLDPDPLAARPFVEEKGGAHPPELVVYYEVWSRKERELELSSLILDRRDRERHRRTLARVYPAGVTHNLLRVPLHELGSGDYQLELRLTEPAADKSPRKDRGRRKRPANLSWQGDESLPQGDPHRRSARFTVRWRGEPVNPSDLDRAVEQLRYVLPVRRFKELQEAPMGRKKALFDEFWVSVDPTPETDSNELMAEYYRRAEFADRRFSWSRFAGWRSDRGRIYMIHGDPDQVERYEGDLDYPAWERWTYEASGREFIFMDRQGFGDYQLVINPGD
ncbi:MAG: GWxTD domain-containing protein [bacterium]|nr:GWxTD domain-containing protein [bacterium]